MRRRLRGLASVVAPGVVVAGLAGATLTGCDSARDGSGGSVELSWRLRNQIGDLLQCSQGRVKEIALSWDVGGVTDSEAWPCDDNHAITRFVLPEGSAKLTVTPNCESGPAAPATYAGPAPLVRDIKQGEVVLLGAVVLVIQIDDAGGQPVICP